MDNSTGLEAENVTADIAANIQNPEIGLLVWNENDISKGKKHIVLNLTNPPGQAGTKQLSHKDKSNPYAEGDASNMRQVSRKIHLTRDFIWRGLFRNGYLLDYYLRIVMGPVAFSRCCYGVSKKMLILSPSLPTSLHCQEKGRKFSIKNGCIISIPSL